jgi:carotenoid cleavage dioxygenase-like enzyme
VFYTSRQEFYEDSQQSELPKPLELNVIEGELPQDIYGHLFLVAPVGLVENQPNERGWIRLAEDGTPLFNGDGMVYRLDFDGVGRGKVRLSSRIAGTPCFYTDETLEGKGKFGRENIKDFINLGLARLSLDLGFRNQVNTAIIPMKFSEEEGYRLMMTWDAGRPYEIDPMTLKVVTAVGSNEEWDEQIDLQQILEVVNTASHPAFDSDSANGAELFTVSFQKSMQTWLELLSKSHDKNITKKELESKLNNVRNIIEPLEFKTKKRDRQLTSQGIAQFSTNQETEMESSKLLECEREIVPEFERELQKISDENITSDENIADNLSVFFRQMLERINWLFNTLLEVFQEMKDYVKLIRWDGQNKLQIWKLVKEDKTSIEIPDSMHQIAATQDYIVLANTVFKVGTEQLLPNLLSTKLPNLPSWLENNPLLNIKKILEKLLNKLNNELRDFFSYPQSDKTDLYIVRRADLDPERDEIVAKKVSVPMPFPHFMADYDNPNQQITLHVAHNTGWDASSWIRPYDELATGDRLDSEKLPLGMTSGSTDLNYLASYIIDLQDWDNPDKERVSLKGQLLSDEKLTWMSAIATYYLEEGIKLPKTFQNIYWVSWGCWSDLLTDYVVDLYKNYPHRKTTIDELLEITRQGVPVNLCRVDVKKGEIADSYQFGSDVFANSPQFVPRQRGNEIVDAIDSSIDGYIVCVVNTGDSQDTPSEFHIFDAADLEGGAICKLSHEDLKLGMTLHSAWCPTINERRATYKVDTNTDYPLEAPTEENTANFFREILAKYFPDGLFRS